MDLTKALNKAAENATPAPKFYICFLVFCTYVVRAFVFQKIWLWFIVPNFGVSPLNMVAAFFATCFGTIFFSWRCEDTLLVKSKHYYGVRYARDMRGKFVLLVAVWIIHSIFH